MPLASLDPNLKTTGHEDAPCRCWPEQPDIIGHRRLRATRVFETVSFSADEFILTPGRQWDFRPTIPQSSGETRYGFAEANACTVDVTGCPPLTASPDIPVHQSFHAASLENILEPVDMSLPKEEVGSRLRGERPGHPPDVHVHLESSRLTRIETNASPHHSMHPEAGQHPPHQPNFKKRDPYPLKELATEMNGHVTVVHQDIAGFGVAGNVGATGTRHVFSGTQSVFQNGFGVLGDISLDAAVKLQELFLRKQYEDERQDRVSNYNRHDTLRGSTSTVQHR